MRRRQLQDYVARWQRRLRLQDWNVAIKIVPDEQLPDCLGQIEYLTDSRQALLKIRRKIDWPIEEFPENEERVIIHELLHLHFRPMLESKGRTEEQSINAIVDLLYKFSEGKPVD